MYNNWIEWRTNIISKSYCDDFHEISVFFFAVEEIQYFFFCCFKNIYEKFLVLLKNCFFFFGGKRCLTYKKVIMMQEKVLINYILFLYIYIILKSFVVVVQNVWELQQNKCCATSPQRKNKKSRFECDSKLTLVDGCLILLFLFFCC